MKPGLVLVGLAGAVGLWLLFRESRAIAGNPGTELVQFSGNMVVEKDHRNLPPVTLRTEQHILGRPQDQNRGRL
ncbi:hypothetical protein BASA81_003440 [Batrachochytrium salamandrivorans]|nr:hypothetical protein BASA81_003440 [Batrachochytrium salamandrivorans]